MGKTSCDVKKKNIVDQERHDRIEDDVFYNDVNMSNKDKDILTGIISYFAGKFEGKGEPINSKEMQDFINREYGTQGKNKAKRNFAFARLMALLQANPGIREMIADDAMIELLKTEKKGIISADIERVLKKLEGLPDFKDKYTKKELALIKKFAKDNDIPYKIYQSGQTILKNIHMEMRGLNYSTLSLSSLNLLFNKASHIVQKGYGNKLGRGVLGKLRVELSTALGLARHDASGAIYNMAKSVTSYTSSITRHIERFVDQGGNRFNDTSKANLLAKARKYGMESIFNSIEALGQNILSPELAEALDYHDEYVVDFFNRLLAGWVIWDDESLQYKIHENYNVAVDDDGNPRFYKTTGDPIYEYSNPITFEEYNKKKKDTRNLPRDEKEKGERYHRSFFIDDNYIKMVKELSSSVDTINQIDILHNQAKGIHDEVFQYAKKEFERAHNLLMIELKQYFPGLNNDEIRNLLMSSDIVSEPEFKMLTEEQRDDLLYITEAFGSYSILDPYFFGMQDFKEKSGTFPIIYNQDYFQNVMWEEALNEAKLRLGESSQLLNDARELYLKNRNNMEYRDAYAEAKRIDKEQYSEVKRMELIRNRFDEYPVDLKGNIMPLARDVSVLKRITNSFDVRNQRADKLVYNEYLNRMFGGLERNKLSITLLQSLRMAKSDAAKEAIISQYKGINNDPTARSSFLSIPINLDTVTPFINRIPLVNISTDTLSRKIRTFNSWITGMHLRSTSSAILNATAVQEGFFNLGFKNMTRAADVLKKQAKAVANLVKISGIVDFSEFIQQGLVKKATDMDLTEKQADKVVVAILKFWKDRSQGISQNKALKELRKVLIIEADNIPGAEEVEGQQSSRIKARIKRRKSEKRKRVVNTFANYAIEKQYDYKKTVKNIPYQWFGKTFKSWGDVQARFKLTMGETEKWLRTWQFIAGIISAMDSKIIPKVPLADLKGEDLEAAIEIGRAYVQMSAFSVGRENIGEISRGEVGGFLTKFKYYAMQKFGADLDKFQNAFWELKTVVGEDEPSNNLRAISRLLTMTFRFRKYPQKLLRTTHPSVATFRSFMAVQGLITQMVDVLIFGPFAGAKLVPGFRNLIYSVPGMRTIGGMTSDVVSLTMLIPNLLLALSFGWGEDDDEIQNLFEYYMRRTAVGYGVTWTYDNFMLLLSMLKDSDDEEQARRIKRALSPVIPKQVNYIPGRPVDKVINYVAEELIE
tara:strand:+ start:324 stop:3959 length:3636 start_codon:yes stop_codon:yes gene_type:complete